MFLTGITLGNMATSPLQLSLQQRLGNEDGLLCMGICSYFLLKKIQFKTHSFISGRYNITLSSDTHPQQKGFLAKLSIQSGSGVSSHDRIFTFVPCFSNETDAVQYAFENAEQWLSGHGLSHSMKEPKWQKKNS